MGEFSSLVGSAAGYEVFVDGSGNSSVVAVLFVRMSCIDYGCCITRSTKLLKGQPLIIFHSFAKEHTKALS